MSVFGKITTEKLVQVLDKTRISAEKTFVTPDESAITAVRIKPSAADSYIDVFDVDQRNWFLDWKYFAAATETITLEVTNTSGVFTFTDTIEIISTTSDALFSSDYQLISHEHDLYKWLPDGKDSFIFMHRRAQQLILDTLDRAQVRDASGNKITKTHIVDKTEVAEWSKWLTLMLIMDWVSNAADDVYHKKAREYEKKANDSARKASLWYDWDLSGVIDAGEKFDVRSLFITRK